MPLARVVPLDAVRLVLTRIELSDWQQHTVNRVVVCAVQARAPARQPLNQGCYPPPRRYVFLALNQQVTPISNCYRVESNYRRNASGAASREAVLVVSSGALLA